MILYLLQAAFTIWMLVDAIQRRPPYYWYIVVFVPFGPFVYFFAFKLREYDIGWLRNLFVSPERQPSVEELLDRLRRTPSYANRIAYANALYDAGRYADAVKSFEIIIQTRGDDPAALYGLGRCFIELGEAERAIEPLSKLVGKNRAYRDYAACLDLADAYAKAGHDDDALDLLEGLVRASPRVQHHLALAHLLVDAGRIEEAQKALRQGIEEYESSPPGIKKRDRSEAREAEAYLKSIS
jgi:hypothetical protein